MFPGIPRTKEDSFTHALYYFGHNTLSENPLPTLRSLEILDVHNKNCVGAHVLLSAIFSFPER